MYGANFFLSFGERNFGVHLHSDMKKKTVSQDYKKLPQSDRNAEDCVFVDNLSESRETHDGRKRLLAASVFCVLFIVAEITGKLF